MNTPTSCRHCESIVEPGDLRCPVCGFSVPAEADPHDAVKVEVMRCTSCGAAVAYDLDIQAPRCGFCDAVMKVESISDPQEQTETYLPFTVGPREATEAVRRWLGSQGFFRPPDLVQRARVDSIRPLWWVAWVCSADALVSWTADSDTGGVRAAWAAHAGQTDLSFDNIVVSASRGLNEQEAARLARSYDLGTGSGEPSAMPDATVEQFDVQRSKARHQVAAALRATATARLVRRRDIPGSSHRNVKVSAVLRNLETRRVALPAWVLAYRYGDTLYRAVLSGQSRSAVTGQAPLSWRRIATVGAGAALAVVMLIALIRLIAT